MPSSPSQLQPHQILICGFWRKQPTKATTFHTPFHEQLLRALPWVYVCLASQISLQSSLSRSLSLVLLHLCKVPFLRQNFNPIKSQLCFLACTLTNTQAIPHSTIEMFFPRTKCDHVLYPLTEVNDAPFPSG